MAHRRARHEQTATVTHISYVCMSHELQTVSLSRAAAVLAANLHEIRRIERGLANLRDRLLLVVTERSF